MPKYFVQFIYITAEIVRVKFVKFIGVKCHLKKKEEFDHVVFRSKHFLSPSSQLCFDEIA